MSIETQSGTETAIADEEKSSVARVAETAGSEASNVAATAAEGAREVAGEASMQTKAVVSQAKQQVDSLITQTREEVRQQAENRSAQAAGGLRTLSEQVAALAEGRPDSAGSLPRYLEDAQEHVRGWRRGWSRVGRKGSSTTSRASPVVALASSSPAPSAPDSSWGAWFVRRPRRRNPIAGRCSERDVEADTIDRRRDRASGPGDRTETIG